MSKVTKLKINGVPKDYSSMSFGRQLEYRLKISEFKLKAKISYISIKRNNSSKAIKDFIQLNNVVEYWTSFYDSKECRDDSIEIYYM